MDAVELRRREGIYRARALLNFIVEHPGHTTNFYWLWTRCEFRTIKPTFREDMNMFVEFKLIEYDAPLGDDYNYWKWLVMPASREFIEEHLKYMKKTRDEIEDSMSETGMV